MERKYNFETSFEEFYKEYFPFVMKYIYFKVKSLNIAEDMSQELFLRIYKKKKIPSGDGESIKREIQNLAKNMVRIYLREYEQENKKRLKSIQEWEYIELDIDNITIEGEVLKTITEEIEDFLFEDKDIFYQRFYDKCAKDILEKKNILMGFLSISMEVFSKLRDFLTNIFVRLILSFKR